MSKLTCFLALCTIAASAHTAKAAHVVEAKPLEGVELVMPQMDPDRGKELFVEKGCVACHAINGVGGHDAPNLDAHTMDGLMNPFDFAARMWNHAPGMIATQQEALGEQITLTGQELAESAPSSTTKRLSTPSLRQTSRPRHAN